MSGAVAAVTRAPAQAPAKAAVLAALLLLAALALAARAPLWLLLAGPLLLGVPHLAADLRYLVLRPGLHRRGALLLAAGAPLLFCCVRPTLWAGLLAAGGALLASRAPARRKAALGALCLCLLAAALWAGRTGDLLLAHLHNLLALGFAAALWPGPRARLLWPAATVAAGACVLLFVPLPALLPAATLAPGAALAGLEVENLRAALAPGLPEEAATRVVLLYGFLQSAHYASWLVLIPAAAAARAHPPAPAPGCSRHGHLPPPAHRSALHDLGAPLLAACALLAAALAAWALVDAAAARDGYLRFAGFHGHLELAALALWAAEGRPAA